MSTNVNLIPILEITLQNIVIPEINRLSDELSEISMYSFGTQRQLDTIKELEVVTMFSDMIREVIDGIEEHTFEKATDLINVLNSYFGVSIIELSNVNTYSDPPPPPPPPPEALNIPKPVITSVTEENDQLYGWFVVPELIESNRPFHPYDTDITFVSDPNLTPSVIDPETGHTLYVQVKTSFTGSTIHHMRRRTDVGRDYRMTNAVVEESMAGTNVWQRKYFDSEPFARISWDTDAGYIGYEIYRNGVLIQTIIGGDIVSYDDKTAEQEVLYTYTIRALWYQYGYYSEISAGVNITLSKYNDTISVPVLNEANVLSSGDVYLSWTNVPEAVEYFIFRDGLGIGSTTELNFIDLEENIPSPKVEVTYHVTAFNELGIQSGPSNSIAVTPLEAIYSVTQSIPTINSATSVKLMWGNSYNITDVRFNIYMNDVLLESDIEGTRTVPDPSKPDVWNVEHVVVVPDTTSERVFYITTTLDTRESDNSNKDGINLTQDPDDVKLWINGIFSYSYQSGRGELPFPSDGIFELRWEYHGTESVSSSYFTMYPQFFEVVEPVNKSVVLTPADNYRVEETLAATTYPPSFPAALFGSANYYDSAGEKVESVYHTTVLSEGTGLDKVYSLEDLLDGGFRLQVTVLGSTIFQIGDVVTFVGYETYTKELINVLVTGGKTYLYFTAHIGDTIPSGTEVIIAPDTPILTLNDLTDNNNYVSVEGTNIGNRLEVGTVFEFDGYGPTQYTVTNTTLSYPVWFVFFSPTRQGGTIPTGTELIII